MSEDGTTRFSQLWRQLVERFGIVVDYVPGNWRRGVSVTELASRLSSDRDHTYKAVMVVHNETSTGVTTSIRDVRQQMDPIEPSGPADGGYDLLTRLD